MYQSLVILWYIVTSLERRNILVDEARSEKRLQLPFQSHFPSFDETLSLSLEILIFDFLFRA